MCGIVGAVGKIPPEQLFIDSRDSLSHRGPDDAGLFYDAHSGVALGHCRLSIIDLTTDGHQPFLSHDGRYVLVFNGEIYNYLELKEELKDFYSFNTKTDTEVLLAAFLMWGEKCLDKFNGMFAFAIWDRSEKKLFCGRDRLGVKPFYYFCDENSLFFASEIKALFKMGVKPKANHDTIFDYLHFGLYDHTEETFFSGIKMLPPGHFLVWQNSKINYKKYWDLADKYKDFSNWSEEQLVNHFGELLTDSIKLRFRSDVPVGLNLSSGLDSNSLYYYAQKVTGSNIDIFSMCLSSDEYDECGLIDKSLSEEKKKYWHKCFLNPQEVLEGAEKMDTVQDQPYGGIPTIAYDSLIRLSRDAGVTVLLEGQGVDEILAGYPYYIIENEKDISGKFKDIETVAYGQDMTKLTDHELLSKDFLSLHQERRLEFFKPFNSHLLNAQYRDVRYTKLPRVLRFNDHVTMKYSRELRVPFLDYRLVEFCFFLPSKYKIRDNSQKYILRKLLAGIVPEETKDRQKKVFGAIQSEWFKKYFKEQVFSIVGSQSFRNRGYWDYEKLDRKIKEFYSGQTQNSFFIWQCINLEIWFRQHIDQRSY